MTNKYQVWTYWTGDHYPALDLLLDSVRHCYPQLQVLDDGALRALGGDEPLEVIRDCKLNPWHGSDLIRLWLLSTYGGLWIDTDCLAFEPLPVESLWAVHPMVQLIGFSNTYPRQFPNPVLLGKPGDLTQALYQDALAVAPKKDKVFLAMGSNLISSRRVRHPRRMIVLPREPWLHPWHHGQLDQLADHWDGDWGYHYCYLLHTEGRNLRRFKDWTRERLISSRTPMGYLIRQTSYYREVLAPGLS